MKNLFLFLSIVFLSYSCGDKPQRIYTITGRVIESGSGKPIANAHIRLLDADSGSFGSGSVDSELTEGETFTDADGNFSFTYDKYVVNFFSVTADGYYRIRMKEAREDQPYEVLEMDAHAWLQVRVRNVAPAGELDRIDLGSSVGPSGNNQTYSGADVDLSYVLLKRGNQNNDLVWSAHESGVRTISGRESIYIPAHDTVYHEINY